MQKEFDKVAMDKEEGVSGLRDNNHKLLLQIEKAKDKAQDNQKLEEENQDLQKKLLENIEENGRLKNHKQDLMDHIQKIKDDKKAQEEIIRNLKNDKVLLENKQSQIQKRKSNPSDSKSQVHEKEANTNPVFIIVQKEANIVKKQTTRTPYQHPKYKNHFDQRQGQNEHKQRNYDFRKERTQNQQTKQNTRSSIQQGNQQTTPIKIDFR